MKDREFIEKVIDNYLLGATNAHQATLNNAVINRLNDMVRKIESKDKMLKILEFLLGSIIIFAKNKNQEISAPTYEDYANWMKKNQSDDIYSEEEFKKIWETFQ